MDKTIPVNRITGLEKGRERFNAEKLEFTLYPEDYQTGIREVTVRILESRILGSQIRDSRILAVTMPAEDNVRDVFDALVSTGIPVFVHTLNDPEAQAQWIHDGAYGVYTDYGDVRTETE